MSSPVSQTHPAEVVFTVEALHVVAAAVLLDADVALGAVLGVGGDVVGSFTVVSTLGQPASEANIINKLKFSGYRVHNNEGNFS